MEFFYNDFPSTLIISLLSSLLFLLILLKSRSISKNAKQYSHFSGPKPLPLIGNLHLMLRSANPHRLFTNLAAKYGPLFHLQLGETHFLIISSTDLAKQVMKAHDINFANRPPGVGPEFLFYNYNDVAFAPYGENWRQMKKICTLQLLSERRVQSFRHIREEENMNLAKEIASSQGSPVDLTKKLHLLAYDVVTRAAVGGKTSQRAAMIRIVKEIEEVSSGFMLADIYPSVKWLQLITGARFKIGRIHRKQDKLYDTIIEQHKSTMAKADERVSENLVDVLLKIQADGSERLLTNDRIKAVLMDMFGAGTDTSTITVEWAMSEMIKNPSKLKKAQEEIRKVFDNKGYVDEEQFTKLKYLKLVIKETLRMHPPAPLVPRMNYVRCEINGYEIPAKTRVIVNAWALGRDSEYWNEPEKFEPERFEDSSIDFKGNNFEFIPFGAGRRMCPGIAFGMANVEYPLAMLLYHFDWKMPLGMKNEELNMSELFGATVNRKIPLHLIPIVKRPLPAAA